MKSRVALAMFGALCALAFGTVTLLSQEKAAPGTSNLVSFKPYLDRLQRYFDNQYYAVFQGIPKKKPGLQRVNFMTEVPNAEIAAADNVWVPAGT
jgi:hypothetical protein